MQRKQRLRQMAHKNAFVVFINMLGATNFAMPPIRVEETAANPAGMGLKNFSRQVWLKVAEKKTTDYNEVSFSRPCLCSMHFLLRMVAVMLYPPRSRSSSIRAGR